MQITVHWQPQKADGGMARTPIGPSIKTHYPTAPARHLSAFKPRTTRHSGGRGRQTGAGHGTPRGVRGPAAGSRQPRLKSTKKKSRREEKSNVAQICGAATGHSGVREGSRQARGRGRARRGATSVQTAATAALHRTRPAGARPARGAKCAAPSQRRKETSWQKREGETRGGKNSRQGPTVREVHAGQQHQHQHSSRHPPRHSPIGAERQRICARETPLRSPGFAKILNFRGLRS